MNHDNADVISMTENRGKTIVRTSIIGILTNVLLEAFKAVLALFVNSIALLLDAVINISDALSSVVTIVGEKFASKASDKKHPMGYGRIEYLSAMITAVLVLYAGITSLVESIKKIINPSEASYTILSIVIIGVAVVIKFMLGQYVKRQGKKVNSTALIASGSDSLFDSILSLSVFISAIIFMKWGISLEAYVGVVISVFMIKAGIEMMISTVDDLIGHRADKKVTSKVKDILDEEDAVLGVYDLALFNYGPNSYYASAHVELKDTMNVSQVDKLTRKLQYKLYKKTGIVLIALGVYSFNTQDEEARNIRENVEKRVMSHDWALQVHGFYADTKNKILRFDVVLSFDVDRKESLEILKSEIESLYPDYQVQIVPDLDL